jgi:hypothetical protein
MSDGHMPFRLFISFQRRKMILDALIESEGTDRRKKGEKVLKVMIIFCKERKCRLIRNN